MTSGDPGGSSRSGRSPGEGRALEFAIANGRQGLRVPFVAATVFFVVWPLLSMLASRPDPVALVLLLIGWAIFGGVVLSLFRVGPFVPTRNARILGLATVALTAIASFALLRYGVGEASALYFYAGVTVARITPERWGLLGIGIVALISGVVISIAGGDVSAGITVGVTVGTICLTLFALGALGRTNRALREARRELAELAVAEERSRIARDLHDTLGHSLSVIALKSELARRLLPEDPERAAREIADVEHVARESLASVRETVSGYRQPSLATELAGARSALAAAGIDGDVEPAPEGLPREVDAVLGWAVREGVTNVLRHSDAERARIRVRLDDDLGAVEIEDDGRGEIPASTASGGGGTGLAGLRERAVRLGGTLEAGPLPDRGFRLRVAIPIGPVPPIQAQPAP